MKVNFDINASIEVVKQEQLEKERKIQYEKTKEGISQYLRKYQSPLVGLEDYILSVGDKYRLPYSLLLAIGRKESSLGRAIKPTSYNLFGVGGVSQYRYYQSFEDAIEKTARLIATDKIYHEFQTTGSIEALSRIYCETHEEWYRGVTTFKEEIEEVAPDYRVSTK